jgi:hypothetical protein
MTFYIFVQKAFNDDYYKQEETEKPEFIDEDWENYEEGTTLCQYTCCCGIFLKFVSQGYSEMCSMKTCSIFPHRKLGRVARSYCG